MPCFLQRHWTETLQHLNETPDLAAMHGESCNGLHVSEPFVGPSSTEDFCKRLLRGCTLADEMTSI